MIRFRYSLLNLLTSAYEAVALMHRKHHMAMKPCHSGDCTGN